MPKRKTLRLAHISVRGIVQGVGFRPFVYGLATKHDLTGWVYNTSEDVKIEVEGEAEAIEQFKAELQTEFPPLAHIEDISVTYLPAAGYESFEIRPSIAVEGKCQLISPDIATCKACLSELLNPNDRRYHYPFTNCTNCGPRFTIIDNMPYDRPSTTMRHFQMCPLCQAEYNNPQDRRFHAQPNACPECGPKVELAESHGKIIETSDPIASAGQLLIEGKIVAIKGLGGFLLACDASNETVIKTLRQRKKRPFKPLAIMVTNLAEAQKHCYVSPEEAKLLSSPQSPIVLMRWRVDSSLSREVAPNLEYLGVMLPYTPLHHLLLRYTQLPLVMTSGNISEEPIAKDNDEAFSRLSGIADYFLIHNRDISSSYDDSVAMIERKTSQLIRRARSYAPDPIHLKLKARQVLGCGAQMKSTFCLTRDNYAFMSQHIGDLENMETLEHFADTISLYNRLFHIQPEIIAHDLHPDYLSTTYAQELAASGVKLIPVQHHHAHIASCMADNGLQTPVIGVAFDGTGLGSDGNVWGGEFLVADYRSFNRVCHLQYLPLPGGDEATKNPYRITISYLLGLLGENALNTVIENTANLSQSAHLKQVSEAEIQIIKHQLERGLNSPLTSSMGRLFDAVSALIGIRDKIDYEGQAAVELEMIAYKGNHTDNQYRYPYHIAGDKGVRVIELGDLLSAIVKDLVKNVPREIISNRFHNTIARVTNDVCQMIASETGIKQVALSGGVFQNRLLLRKTINLLETSGFQVFTHSQVPCNDGGISLGQAVIASFA